MKRARLEAHQNDATAEATASTFSSPAALRAPAFVIVNVGGTKFTSSVSTLSASSEYFLRLFSGRWTAGEEVFLDRDARPFEILLTYMRSSLIELPEADLSMWRRVLCEADYLGIGSFALAIKARTHRNTQLQSWSGTDEEAVTAFDEKHGSLEDALKTGVLPASWFCRRAGRVKCTTEGSNERWNCAWQPESPRVFQVLPATDHEVHFEREHASGLDCLSWGKIVRTALSLALVQWPEQAGPTLDAFITDDHSGGAILASRAFPANRKYKWRLVKRPTTHYIHLPEGSEMTPVFWKNKDDHSEGTHNGSRGGITLLRITDEKGVDAEHRQERAFQVGNHWIGNGHVEPLELRHVRHDSDDSDDDAENPDEVDEAGPEGEGDLARQQRLRRRENRRRDAQEERRNDRQVRRRGKLMLHNVMQYTNFKGFENVGEQTFGF